MTITTSETLHQGNRVSLWARQYSGLAVAGNWFLDETDEQSCSCPDRMKKRGSSVGTVNLDTHGYTRGAVCLLNKDQTMEFSLLHEGCWTLTEYLLSTHLWRMDEMIDLQDLSVSSEASGQSGSPSQSQASGTHVSWSWQWNSPTSHKMASEWDEERVAKDRDKDKVA